MGSGPKLSVLNWRFIPLLWSIVETGNASGISDDERAIGNIFGYDGAGGNKAAAADFAALDDRCADTDDRLRTNLALSGDVRAGMNRRIGVYPGVMTDGDAAADADMRADIGKAATTTPTSRLLPSPIVVRSETHACGWTSVAKRRPRFPASAMKSLRWVVARQQIAQLPSFSFGSSIQRTGKPRMSRSH